jgi:hypothetical protein
VRLQQVKHKHNQQVKHKHNQQVKHKHNQQVKHKHKHKDRLHLSLLKLPQVVVCD